MRKLSLGVRIGGIVENSLLDIRVRDAVQDAARIVMEGSVITKVGASGEVASRADGKAWASQGDEALSTRTKFEERFKLRHASKVNEVLHAFWVACVRSSGRTLAEQRQRKAMASETPGLLDVQIGFNEYHALYSRVFKTLLDDYDEETARAVIQADFDRDAKGDEVITNGEYGDSLFELADHWVSSVHGRRGRVHIHTY